MIELTLPSFGADMEDAEFVRWMVQPGQHVARGDIACVVETQKGAIDVEVWQAGTVAVLTAQPGQRIPVGGRLALLAAEGEDWQVGAAVAPAQAAAATPPTPAATAAAPTPAATAAPAQAVAAAATQAPVALPAQPAAPAPAGAAPARISPAARKRAAELGLDLGALARGRGDAPLTLADVERAAGTAPQDAMRSAIAAAMARSKREIPHYYLGTEVVVEPALRWLEAFNAQRPLPARVLFAALALKAIALALAEAPQLNGRFADGRFQPSRDIHLGVVTALRGGGLLVPTVRDADRLALPELMAALGAALERARGGRLRSSDLGEATATVTNLGELGADSVYGVIYPPQVALVGLGRVQLRPVAQDGAVSAARVVHLSLAADHRVSDGMVGARFLAGVRDRLAHPEAL